MDGLASVDLKSVVAPLNFLAPMAERPVAYNYEPPPGTPQRTGRNVQYQVQIRDARPMVNQLSLDKEGFVLLHHQTAVSNFYDEEQIKSVYYPECERVMKEATGAIRVVAFDHIVRNASMSAKDKTIKIPAKRVHNDYTAWSAPQRVRDLMGDEAEELLKHRFAVNNLWRPISGPVFEIAADLMRRAEPQRRKPDCQRSQIPGPHRRDLLDHLQPEPTLLLFPEDAGRRGGADPLLRTRRSEGRRGFPPTPASTTHLAARCAAAREPRSPHAGVLPARRLRGLAPLRCIRHPLAQFGRGRAVAAATERVRALNSQSGGITGGETRRNAGKSSSLISRMLDSAWPTGMPLQWVRKIRKFAPASSQHGRSCSQHSSGLPSTKRSCNNASSDWRNESLPGST